MQRPSTVRVVAINDVYTLAHFPRLATLLAHARAGTGPFAAPADDVLVTLAGDFLAPSLLASLDSGRSMVRLLNALGVTHVCFGNHEDDVPFGALLARAEEFRGVWLSTNTPTFAVRGRPLPRGDLRPLPGGGTLALFGVVVDDPAAYRRAPFGGVPIAPPNEALLSAVAGSAADGIVPLTHQLVADDRALAAALSGDRRVPIVLGGHDHMVVDETVAGARILKAGADAVHAYTFDLVITPGSGAVARDVTLRNTAEFPEDPEIAALVTDAEAPLRALTEATLVRLPEGVTLSSVGTRSRPTSLATFLCGALRAATGADACLFNGGGIRAARVYTGALTYGDLVEELPFDNEVVVAPLPGAVLAEAIASSRAHAPAERGGYLHTDDGVVVDGENRVLAVAGAPFDPARRYAVAVVRNLLFGMDHVAPLVAWAAAHPDDVPAAGSGREGKVILVEAFAEALWRALGDDPLATADRDEDGRVSVDELSAALSERLGLHASLTATLVHRALDRDGDGAIDRREAALLIGS